MTNKTLYVSDLDGTLLHSDESISEYTSKIINKMTDNGILFSYATARSLVTAKQVTKGIDAKIPLIIYNGSFIVDNVTNEILKSNFFDNDAVLKLIDDLIDNNIYPIVYAYLAGKEKFSYVPRLANEYMRKFTDSRIGDIRENRVDSLEELKLGDKFYITCIDESDKLFPMYEKYKNVFHCIYQKDVYTKDQWLEIMPKFSSKANAIVELKKMFNCDKVVVFGDGRNDIDMFEIADESYAVSNADEVLKKKATGIIDSNNNDGVAKWLDNNLF